MDSTTRALMYAANTTSTTQHAWCSHVCASRPLTVYGSLPERLPRHHPSHRWHGPQHHDRLLFVVICEGTAAPNGHGSVDVRLFTGFETGSLTDSCWVCYLAETGLWYCSRQYSSSKYIRSHQRNIGRTMSAVAIWIAQAWMGIQSVCDSCLKGACTVVGVWRKGVEINVNIGLWFISAVRMAPNVLSHMLLHQSIYSVLVYAAV